MVVVRVSAIRKKVVSPSFAIFAILLAALTLRAPIAALPPVVSFLSADLHLTPAQAGLLTSIPVLSMAVLTVAGSGLISRLGIADSMVVALSAIIAGQLLRSAGSFPLALLGTALIGTGIAIGNVAMPMLISRDYKNRSAGLSGAYAATMNIGSGIATMAVVPIAYRFGWQIAAGLWAVVGVLALAVWLWRWRGSASLMGVDGGTLAAGSEPNSEPLSADQSESRNPSPLAPPHPGSSRLAKPPLGRAFGILTLLLCIVYIGQSSSYYAVTAWLPEMLNWRLGLDRAAAATVAMPFQLLATVGALAVPILARYLPLRAVAMLLAAFWLTMPLGMLLAPQFAIVWASLAGMGHGGTYTVMLTLLAARAPNPDATRRASAIVLTVGYSAAAVAPTLYGAIFQHTATWTIPLLIILATLVTMSVAVWLAAKAPRRTQSQAV